MRTNIEKDRRRDMYALEATGLNQQLEVVCDFVATVQTAILVWLVGNLKKAVNLLLVKSNATSQLGEPLVGPKSEAWKSAWVTGISELEKEFKLLNVCHAALTCSVARSRHWHRSIRSACRKALC